MLRRIIIFFVTLVHVNGSMLLPQVAEVDIYNAQGQQQDDINSIIEYVDEIILDNHHDDPVDEDNDQGQNFHLVKVVDYYYELAFTTIKDKPVAATGTNKFCMLPEEKIVPVTLEILAPPPKASLS